MDTLDLLKLFAYDLIAACNDADLLDLVCKLLATASARSTEADA